MSGDVPRQGRVLALTAQTLVLFDRGQVAVVPFGATPTPPRPGDLVTVHSDGQVVVHHAGPGQWPPAAGSAGADLGRFQGARWQTLGRRAALVRATRAYFDSVGFLEVETPLVVPSPGTEVHLDPVPVQLRERPGATPTERWLITSPEYAMKRLLAAGAGPIYQIAKVFRDGERGGRHRPEFTMLEWYRPFVDGHDALVADCESWFLSLSAAIGTPGKVTWRGRTYDLTPPWPRITFFDLLRERAHIAAPEALDEDRWIEALVSVEPTLGRDRPEVVHAWPLPLASLSRPSAADPRVAERFEFYLGGLELGNAFAELTDAAEQRRRCVSDNDVRRATGKPEIPLDEDFLGALEVGMPPSAGIAVGLDRVVMIFSDAATIDDVVAF